MSVHTHSAPFLLEHFCHVEDFFPKEHLSCFCFRCVDFWRCILSAFDVAIYACAGINVSVGASM